MKGFRIKLGDDWIPDSRLRSVNTKEIVNEYERKAVVFCQCWLADKQAFEFRTSGSTGTPKEITFKREQLIASAELTGSALKLRSGNTSLVCLDTDFIAGAMMLVRGMVIGMDMIIKAPSANPLENIFEHVDFTALVPYQVIHLLENDLNKFNSISNVIIGGASLNQGTIESLQSMQPEFYATYGMTETITHIALQKLNGIDRQDYFQLLPGIDASTDARQCLVIRASHLGDKPIITNDIVSLLEKDRFKWIGRYDRVINSGGIKISPERIEKAVETILSELKINNRFFIDSVTDQKVGHQVVMVIEGQVNDTAIEKITAELKNILDKYELPKKIIYISVFVETATMKIDRNATMKGFKN